MRRVFWMLVYPLCVVANKLGLLSYRWVNVSSGAFSQKYFDALWHHEWYGTPIADFPAEANLCGLRYKVSFSDGLVSFICRDSWTRIDFTRDPHDRYAMLWYVTLTGNVPAEHFDSAYRWVKAVCGGSFDIKRKPVDVKVNSRR